MWLKCRPQTKRNLLRLTILTVCFLVLAQSGILLALELGAVRIYRSIGSPISARVVTCQYEVTCSTYALDALRHHGFWQGNRLIAGRLLMCSPIGWLHYRLAGPDSYGVRRQTPTEVAAARDP